MEAALGVEDESVLGGATFRFVDVVFGLEVVVVLVDDVARDVVDADVGVVEEVVPEVVARTEVAGDVVVAGRAVVEGTVDGGTFTTTVFVTISLDFVVAGVF